ncbi:MAG TPA: secretin N-terminal domain-containing protein [Bacteroidia bacterium]|nr:secretin N-terminal domain-containing protein [Bacteroidia bacterium]
MKKFYRLLPLIFLLPIISSFGSPEDEARFDVLKNKLVALSDSVPGLKNKVELSVNGIQIQEFIRGLAVTNNLNVSVEPNLETEIFDNFSNVTVTDVFLFLCRRYQLDITFIGNIMVFSKYVPPPPVALPYSPKLPDVTWNATTAQVSFDLQNDSLSLVARELTRKTGKNVVFAPDLLGKKVNGFIQNESLKSALEKLAFANDLKINSSDTDFFLIQHGGSGSTNEQPDITPTNAKPVSLLPAGTKLSTANGLITLDATNVPIGDLINTISGALQKQYFLFTDIKGTTTLSIKDATYEQFLDNVFNGTDFTYRKKNETFYIGDRNLEGLRVTHLVKMQYRSVDKVVDYIPADFKKNVDIKTFPDLNSIILSGSEPRINEIESFLRQIDQVVPMVLIEVIIIDVNNSHTVSAGIQAGLGTAPQSNGQITPSVDVTASGNEINNLISGINGLGILTLGYITPDFYVHLTALEENGVLHIRSTPKLATLNGNEAKMSIGSTEYYSEQTTNIIGTQNPQTQVTTTYKPLNADLSITITPMVSGDEQVTLNVSVTQSTFTKRVSDTGPFGTTQRSFTSVVRVKNQQMILLGGLEENAENESGKGTPWLSRLPFFKWIFGLHTKTKSKTKLSVLIRPTVIY